MIWLLSSLLFVSSACAQMGKVSTVSGNDSLIMRKGTKSTLTKDYNLKDQDQIVTNNSESSLLLNETFEVKLGKNTEVRVIDVRTVELKKGAMKILSTKKTPSDLRIETEGAVFTGPVKDLKVTVNQDKDVDLELFAGQVEASSPFIHSFVPEYVKANEGITFSMKTKKFSKRNLKQKK